MKTRFSTLDISAVLTEINAKLVGMRLANVYDINNKTYLLKLAKPDVKAMLLMESGIRLHISEFDWPKNMMPSGFSMKLRKHLKGRRLIYAKQLGVDRIVDMQFGTDDAAFHIILELYDRGNIILTDHQYTILNILRFRKDKTQGDANADDNADVRIAVQEIYPCDAANKRKSFAELRIKIEEALKGAKNDDNLKRILNPHLPYGAACIEHCLLKSGFPANAKFGKEFKIDENLDDLFSGLHSGEELLDSLISDCTNGWIVQKSEKKSDGTTVLANIEFHPILFKQHENSPHVKYESFNKAVDEFFGSLESQKADMKILQQEKSAHKKLENIRKDHEQRLSNLEKEQATDLHKAQLIEENLTLVDQALHVVRTAIANQIDWGEISSLIKDAQANEDPVAMSISKLNLKSNEFTMALYEVTDYSDSDDDSSSDEGHKKSKKPKPVKVDIDIGLSAYGNAKKYYNKKRQALVKQQKIIDASGKALKSAEKKTKLSLKEAAVVHSIQKARKTFWFEKFLWFISSENYLVIGGRDAQQNEILVKKYLTGGDLYVHADLHGATSCIIKNPTNAEVPPKTLNEAGTMAICHSAAWSAKVVTSAWWVNSHQVSKTAPSGEYLTTGSFLIRGKKNYLPPSYLVYGFGLLFKVDETCVHKHKDERKVSELQSVSEQDISDAATTESISSEMESELTIDSDTDGSDSENETNDSQITNENGVKTEEIDEKEEISAVNNDDIAEKQERVVEFPDTNVQVKYGALEDHSAPEENPDIVYLGDEEAVPVRQNATSKPRISAKQRRDAKKKSQSNTFDDDTMQNSTSSKTAESSSRNSVPENQQQPVSKRGQKNKMKKLKNKYKDQDEEERLLKMELLQQSQSQKVKDRKAKKAKSQPNQQKEMNQQKQKKQHRPKPVKSQENEYDSDEERNKILENEHLSEESVGILNSLTGCPLPDDILMFALPVCAPYNTMHNYKFKVKLTPGNTKKGKGAKTALNLFQNMRETTTQEKDHLRSIKDHDLAHNMPGKVKVSSTNLQLQKKKK